MKLNELTIETNLLRGSLLDLYACINGSAVFGVIVLPVHLNDINGVNTTENDCNVISKYNSRPV
jgi:hypothetical protein